MKFIALFIIAIIMQFNALSQKRYVTDSIYYLVDTSRTLVKDRMVDVYFVGANLKCFEIKCPCLKNGEQPIIEYNIKRKGKVISVPDFNKLKLVTLPELIKKIKPRFEDGFDEIQVYQIIEPEGDHYIMHQADIAALPVRQKSIDIITVKKPL
ncbi:hypothetical protein HQ865_16870 [Mucilaginibacter mali]|uniref:Uncharacterized protein n=1 Tax=Mucilaginibacter mali TaxID=2740462 RepID=A0A7D4PW16_9SPHI|nr:hypothetical protein [Mucilaginibacter mali]QKJ31363.1 hypothetical protein HQ865_16870 [Mucilaginibacter mali]